MEEIVALIAVLSVFGMPTFLLTRFMKYRHTEKMKALPGGQADQKEMARLKGENLALEERVRTLESIVCDVDFELNAKLNRLASAQLAALPPSPAKNGEGAEGAPTVPMSLAPGTKLADRFLIEETIGQGGMGTVYRAKDERLGEVVALKLVAGLALLDPNAAERLRNEASSARRISHPNVVRLHDIGEHRGALFLSMEYVPGLSLSDVLRRHGQLRVAQARSIADQLLSGLAAAHAVGVVHRDLKPGNVIVDDAGNVKIIDFGLARHLQLQGMSTTGMLVGTPEYMAPEQIRGGNIDGRVDIYATGALLYHALCGRPPFTGDNPIAISMSHVSDPVTPPSTLRPDLAGPWEELLMTALSKDPNARFADADAMRAALPS